MLKVADGPESVDFSSPRCVRSSPLPFQPLPAGATIPVTLRTVEQRLVPDNKVASFSAYRWAPPNARAKLINMDGTAIMQGIAAGLYRPVLRRRSESWVST